MSPNNHTLDITTLETWLWEAACKIRGPVDAPKFKDYILPLVFLKRLSDVFDDEVARLGDEFGSRAIADRLVEDDHDLVRFYLPPAARWSHLAKLTTGLGEALTDAVRAVSRENPKLAGVIDVVDFNATQAGQRMVGDDRLRELVQVLGQHRLGLRDVEPDILGRAYEYLLRKFAEGQGQSAGEFYTPRQVGVLMARLLDPQPGMTLYDPTSGSGGLLIKAHLRLLETHGVQQNGINAETQRCRAAEESMKNLCASPPLRLCVKDIRNQRRDAEVQRRTEIHRNLCASPPLRLCVKDIRNQRRDAERQRRRELIQNLCASALRSCARVEVARH